MTKRKKLSEKDTPKISYFSDKLIQLESGDYYINVEHDQDAFQHRLYTLLKGHSIDTEEDLVKLVRLISKDIFGRVM